MQTSSPPVITPIRSQSNPDDMITLPRPIQRWAWTCTMFRARLRARLCRGKEGLHRAPTFVRQIGGYTHILLLFLSSTHYCPLFHPLLSEISSSSCKDLARGSAGSKTPDVVTICGWSAAGRRPTRILSYKDALHRTQCESIETTVGTRRLLWAGALLRMGDHRLPKRVMSGELENVGKRGPGGKERVDGMRGR